MDHVPIGEPGHRGVIEPAFRLAVLLAVLAHLLLVVGLAGNWAFLGLPGGSGPPPVGEGKDPDAIGVLLVDDPDPTTRNMAPPEIAKPPVKAQPQVAPTQQASAAPPPLRGIALPEGDGPAQQESEEKPEKDGKDKKADEEKADEKKAEDPAVATNESEPKSDSATAKARAGRIDHFVRGVIEALGKTKPSPQPIRATVIVEFILSEKGEVEMVKVISSSGIPVVDDMAVEAIRHAHFSRPPPEAERIHRTFHIAYHFG